MRSDYLNDVKLFLIGEKIQKKSGTFFADKEVENRQQANPLLLTTKTITVHKTLNSERFFDS
ncbi:hypothetical protein AAKU61_000211 [Undibacterium sp. GrIS 1.2]